jgi:ATP-dependent helicase/nuclease subunit A
MAWTDEQLEAINHRGKNLLVAAAAGSGKTSVLVERIIKRILDDNIDVDKLLIVTFTRDAASEMKERIYASIQSRLKDSDNPRRLLEQQALLSKAHISTISSFCQYVVKSNFRESGIDSSFRVADDNETLLIKEEVLDDVLEKWYEKKDPHFHNLVETYGGSKTDDNLKSIILNLHSFIQSFPYPFEWLDEQKKILNPKRYKDFGETIWGKEALEYLEITLESLLSEAKRTKAMAEEFGVSGYLDALGIDVEMLGDLCSMCKNASWEEAFEIMNSFSFVRLGRVGKEDDREKAVLIKKRRDTLKKELGKLVSEIFGGSKDAAMKDMELVYKDIRRLVWLVKYFHLKFQNAKKERKIFDFSDMDHIALNILAKKENGRIVPTDVALKLREKFEEIYIDEYQDTNLTQETILQVIARGNNIFHVGDVKQSIYSFRQARPDLFLNKYHEYSVNTEKNKLVRLYKNFRSRRDVVGSVNYIFSRIMNEKTAEMDYVESEYLNYGATYYDDAYNSECELLIIENKDSTKENTYLEAMLIASKIRKLFEDGFMVYDKREKTMRKIQYKDIVILMRSVSEKADIFRQVFASCGIPLYYEGKGGFFASLEISVVLAFLSLIDNPLQDIPLITVLRSPMFEFSDAEISLIRLHKKDCLFYEALLEYAESGYAESLREKINEFLNVLGMLRDKSVISSTAELVWDIVTITGYYTYVGLMEDGGRKQANLRLLFEKAASFDEGSHKGIYRFLNYMENLKKKKGDLSEASAISEGMDVVRIMTIHKSKGLEFPVVFLANTAQEFNTQDVKGRFVRHKTLGIGPSCFDRENMVVYPSVMKEIVERRIIHDNKAEEMRILYVGLTRAREKLIVTGSIKEDCENWFQNIRMKCDFETLRPVNFSILESKSFLEWIAMSLAYHHLNGRKDEKTACNWIIQSYTKDEIEIDKLPDFVAFFEKKEEVLEEDVDEKIHEKVSEILGYEYPCQTLSTVPSKVSVTEVKRLMEEDFEDEFDLMNREVSFKELPDFMDEKTKDVSHALKGTLLHACLQQIDFNAVRNIESEEDAKAYVDSLIDNMLKKRFMTEVQAKAIERKLVVLFILSPFAKRIMQADRVEREVPFTIIKKWGELLGKRDEHADENVAVQGIIDCYFEEDGEIVVVDFKSDYIPQKNMMEVVVNRYKIQIDLYKEALEKITGRKVKESYIYLLRYGEIISM